MPSVEERPLLGSRRQSLPVADRPGEELLAIFMLHGGVLTTDDLVLVARIFKDQAVSYVARAIVDRQILTFTFRSSILVPRFQFGPCPLQVLPSVAQAMSELTETFEDNALATWFAAPNCWLGQQRPCVAIGQRPDAVAEAARADRHVASGW